ncbi:MAG: DMT family transporter [Clostridia bacterium]|nr:DMT family transporter [Clostridia bacterium]MBQ9514291.1 DMT family transporter [Clostridia bacterium]
MNEKNKQNLIGQVLLFSATIIWGTSFVVLADTIAEVPKFYVIGLRFLSSALIFFVIFHKRILKMNKRTLIGGLFAGISLALAYTTQTIGLEHTTPGKNAFLTSLYCVLAPFLVWIMLKEKPKSYNIIALCTCIIGVGFISFSGGEAILTFTFLGEGMTLFSAVFFAFQLVYLEKYSDCDTASMVFVQLLTTAVFVCLLSLTTELPKGIDVYRLNLNQGLKILYLTVFATIYAQIALIKGQKKTNPSEAAIILSLEAVFGALFSILFGKEKVTVPLIVGFTIIFLSVLMSELKIDLIGLIGKKKKTE